ncbi:MAG TPA: hypothetical protein VGP72_10165 [Planctomycetota bacterium]|jgi:hypothetical protein
MAKRAWFQVHLSTALVLMVVAGVLVGRFVPRKREWPVSEWIGRDGLSVRVEAMDGNVDACANFFIELRNDTNEAAHVGVDSRLRIVPLHRPESKWLDGMLLEQESGQLGPQFPFIQSEPVIPLVTVQPATTTTVGLNVPFKPGAVPSLFRGADSDVEPGRYLAQSQVVWRNQTILSAPVEIEIVRPWTRKRVALTIAEALGILILAGLISEVLARRWPRKKSSKSEQ